MWKKIKPYVLPMAISIIIPVAVGTAAAVLTRNSMDIYSVLKTPPLSPPGIVFPIVWTVLYILMGISAGIVYLNRENNPSAAQKGLKQYAISLIFNFAWSIIFFNIRSPLAALVTLIVLLYLIACTIVSYRQVKPLAAYLQIPYALWVAFAGYLNAGIYFLN